MESIAGRMSYPPDEFGGGVYVSGAPGDGAVEDKREGYAGDQELKKEGESEDSESEEGEDESEEEEEEESESEESEPEDYTSGRGCHDVRIPVNADSGGAQYNGNECEGELNGPGGYGYGEDRQATNSDWMLWSCDICNTTVNIFARDDHIASRPHIRAARKQAGQKAEPLSPQDTYVPMWRCALCDEEMSVFLREEHMFGRQHLRLLRKQQSEGRAHSGVPDTPPTPGQEEDSGGVYVYDGAVEVGMAGITFDDDPDIPPPAFASYEYKLRETFYCITCAAEFDLSLEGDHLADLETWDCALCAKTMHPAAKEMHLQSERHTAMASIYESGHPKDFHCEVCQKSYAPVEREGHLAGMEHRQMAARIELEQRYMKRLHEPQFAPKPPGPLPHTADKGDPSLCGLCGESLLCVQLVAHRAWHCPLTGPSRHPASNTVPESTGTFFCDVCNKGIHPSNKEEHLKGKRHLKKAAKKGKGKAKAGSGAAGKPPKRPYSRKKKKEVPADREYCEVCNKYKRAAGMPAHVKSKKHKRNAAAKLWAAKDQGAGPPSTQQVAQSQPTPPVSPQEAPSGPAPVAPPQLPVLRIPPQLFPPQLPPRIRPQLPPQVPPQLFPPLPPGVPPQRAPGVFPQPPPQVQPQLGRPVLRQLVRPPQLASWALPSEVPRVTPQPMPQPVPQSVPQPAPQAQAVAPAFADSPYVTIMGDQFHCNVCKRHRQLVGIESHMKSKCHKRKVAAGGW